MDGRDKHGVIYVPTEQGFRPLQPDAHTGKAHLALKIASWNARQTLYEVQVQGGTVSGTGIDWPPSP